MVKTKLTSHKNKNSVYKMGTQRITEQPQGSQSGKFMKNVSCV
jgi:hypothetical protein